MGIDLVYLIVIVLIVTIAPFISSLVYKQLNKKYDVKKEDIISSLDISKVLISTISHMLAESRLDNNKIEPLSKIIVEAINYIINTNSDEIDINKKITSGIQLVKNICAECNIKLDTYETLIVKDVLTISIKGLSK